MTKSSRAGATGFSGVIDALVEVRRTIASYQAMETVLLAMSADYAQRQSDGLRSQAGRDREMPWRSAAAEIAAATRTTDRGVQRRMGEAALLTALFPVTLRAWLDGRISPQHVSAVVDAGASLTDDALRGEYERAVLDVAERETPARTAACARGIAHRLDASATASRVAEAQRRRGVSVRDIGDGLAELIATLPAVLAHGIHDRLSQTAREISDAESAARDEARLACTAEPALTRNTTVTVALPPRRVDEIRADVLSDLLLTGTPSDAQLPEGQRAGHDLGAIRARVDVVVSATTLTGADDHPGLLPHGEAVAAEDARRLAAGASGWNRVVLDAQTGTIRQVDRYRPTTAQRRTLSVRDGHCRFPGCRISIRRTDVDHTIDAARGGPTSLDNLAHLCRRHHSLKHATAWTVRQIPDGTLHWTSPHGRHHPDIPRPEVIFVISAAPPF